MKYLKQANYEGKTVLAHGYSARQAPLAGQLMNDPLLAESFESTEQHVVKGGMCPQLLRMSP